MGEVICNQSHDSNLFHKKKKTVDYDFISFLDLVDCSNGEKLIWKSSLITQIFRANDVQILIHE